MASHGIKDRVAIVGMGCTPFGEHWTKGTDDLLIEASEETFAAAEPSATPEQSYTPSPPAMSGAPQMVSIETSLRNCARVLRAPL